MFRAIGLCLMTTAFLSAQLLSQVLYTISPIEQSGVGEFSTADAINDSGQIAGTIGFSVAPALDGCFVLSAGIEHTLFGAGVLHQSCDVGGINNGGQVVGGLSVIITGQNVVIGWEYSSGTVTQLPQVNGFYPVPAAINNLGDIVGRIDNSGFIQSEGNFRFLPPDSASYGINDQRLIVGDVNPCPPFAPCVNVRHAFVFNLTTSAVTDLGTLGGNNSRAVAINNPGQIVGSSELAAGGSHAFMFEGGVMHDLGSLGGNSAATAINDAGVVVGYSSIAPNSVITRAFVYAGGALRDLNDLIPAGSGWTLTRASDINSSGEIVGTGTLNGQTVGFRLDPISIAVNIQIKSGDSPAIVNTRSAGKLPVAILSTASFNAPAEVDQASLTFGRTGDEQSFAFCSGPEDVNHDGLLDLVCHFDTRRAAFQSGDAQAILKGKILDGTPIQGSATVQILR